MPKMKTHKGAAKRLRPKKSGKVKRGNAFKRHLLESKSAKRKRQGRSSSFVHESDMRQVKQMLPYA